MRLDAVMSNPQDSRRELLRLIRKIGPVPLSEVREFASRPDFDFGPGIDVVDVILAYRDLGKLRLDSNRIVSSAP